MKIYYLHYSDGEVLKVSSRRSKHFYSSKFKNSDKRHFKLVLNAHKISHYLFHQNEHQKVHKQAWRVLKNANLQKQKAKFFLLAFNNSSQLSEQEVFTIFACT